MSGKTSTPTPCCKARVSLHDGLRLVRCSACGKVWQTFTGNGSVSFHEPSTGLTAPKVGDTQ